MGQSDASGTFSVSADHPCLAGHFPGHPVVPAVLLLEQVALALREMHGEQLRRILVAKFVQPLLPGQPATVALAARARGYHFAIRHNGMVLAEGQVETSTA